MCSTIGSGGTGVGRAKQRVVTVAPFISVMRVVQSDTWRAPQFLLFVRVVVFSPLSLVWWLYKTLADANKIRRQLTCPSASTRFLKRGRALLLPSGVKPHVFFPSPCSTDNSGPATAFPDGASRPGSVERLLTAVAAEVGSRGQGMCLPTDPPGGARHGWSTGPAGAVAVSPGASIQRPRPPPFSCFHCSHVGVCPLYADSEGRCHFPRRKSISKQSDAPVVLRRAPAPCRSELLAADYIQRGSAVSGLPVLVEGIRVCMQDVRIAVGPDDGAAALEVTTCRACVSVPLRDDPVDCQGLYSASEAAPFSCSSLISPLGQCKLPRLLLEEAESSSPAVSSSALLALRAALFARGRGRRTAHAAAESSLGSEVLASLNGLAGQKDRGREKKKESARGHPGSRDLLASFPWPTARCAHRNRSSDETVCPSSSAAPTSVLLWPFSVSVASSSTCPAHGCHRPPSPVLLPLIAGDSVQIVIPQHISGGDSSTSLSGKILSGPVSHPELPPVEPVARVGETSRCSAVSGGPARGGHSIAPSAALPSPTGTQILSGHTARGCGIGVRPCVHVLFRGVSDGVLPQTAGFPGLGLPHCAVALSPRETPGVEGEFPRQGPKQASLPAVLMARMVSDSSGQGGQEALFATSSSRPRLPVTRSRCLSHCSCRCHSAAVEDAALPEFPRSASAAFSLSSREFRQLGALVSSRPRRQPSGSSSTVSESTNHRCARSCRSSSQCGGADGADGPMSASSSLDDGAPSGSRHNRASTTKADSAFAGPSGPSRGAWHSFASRCSRSTSTCSAANQPAPICKSAPFSPLCSRYARPRSLFSPKVDPPSTGSGLTAIISGRTFEWMTDWAASCVESALEVVKTFSGTRILVLRFWRHHAAGG